MKRRGGVLRVCAVTVSLLSVCSARADVGSVEVVASTRMRDAAADVVHGKRQAANLREIMEEAAAIYVLPVAFIRAVVRVESNFNPKAISRCGAVGLMQLMPVNITSMQIQDPYDPRQNIMGGSRLLRRLANAWRGNLLLTLASYNAGERAVRDSLSKHGEIPRFAETRRYVRRVIGFYRQYLREEVPRSYHD